MAKLVGLLIVAALAGAAAVTPDDLATDLGSADSVPRLSPGLLERAAATLKAFPRNFSWFGNGSSEEEPVGEAPAAVEEQGEAPSEIPHVEERRLLQDARTEDVAPSETTVEGDPMICSPSQGCTHYLGPATVVCYGGHGAVETIEFVGVSHVDGRGKMSRYADYVDDVYSWNARTGEWRFFEMPAGVHLRRAVTCEADEAGASVPSGPPPPKWLDHFRDSGLTFSVVANAKGGRYGIGPSMEVLEGAIGSPEALQELALEDTELHITQWQRQALTVLTESKFALRNDVWHVSRSTAQHAGAMPKRERLGNLKHLKETANHAFLVGLRS